MFEKYWSNIGQGRQEVGLEVEYNIQEMSWVVLSGLVCGRKRSEPL